MMDKTYSKLYTVGLVVNNGALEVYNKKKEFVIKFFLKDIESLSLEDSGDWDINISDLFRGFGQSQFSFSDSPSNIYRITINLKNDEPLCKRVQDFDLLGVKKAVEQFNMDLKKNTQ